jgi:hypothetical protein
VSKMKIFLAALVALAMATPALAVDVTVHGDLNHRFNLYTNQSPMYSSSETIKKAIGGTALTSSNDQSAFWGDIKYRLWTELSTNDGAAKAVYAIELGALRFGDSKYGKGGGATYSGDGVNIETRWAYGDFQLPFVQSKARLQIGLLPWMVNHYVWQETAMGVQLKGDTGPVGYTVGWARGHENQFDNSNSNAFDDADAILLRGDLKPADGVKVGLFGLWQRQDAYDGRGGVESAYEIKSFGNDRYSIYTLGTDGSFKAPVGLFVNWDGIYQGGKVKQPGDQDVSAYFLHADVGMNLGKVRLTLTDWYASGDDDPTDGKIKNFMSTDVDMFDSVVLFEGGFTDDNYFTEAPYIANAGLWLNKLAADFQATDKTKLGGAVLYLRTAKDLYNGVSFEKNIGTELDAYVSHKLYPNVEVALNAGYLFADDVLAGSFSDSGKAEDIWRSTMRVRYGF